MSKEKPAERDAMHQYIGQEAARLLAVYRQEVKKKGGSGADKRMRDIKAAALDLLRETGAQHSLVSLFNVMLGSVIGVPPNRLPWVDEIVDYEARAHNAGRLVKNAEIADKVVFPNYPQLSDRPYVMRGVNKIRNAEWYPAMRDMRRVYLIDNPETV